MQLHRRWCKGPWLVAALLSVGPPLGAIAQPPAADPGVAARERIDRLIGPAACRRDSDCSTLPLPDQACGGPRGWIAFAPAHTDAAALARALAALPPDPPGTLSTCQWRPDPGAVCLGATATGRPGRCTLRDGAATAASPR